MRPAPREPSKQLNAKSLPATKRRAASGLRLSAQAEPAASKIKTTIANRVTIPKPLPSRSAHSDLLLVSGRWVALALGHEGLWVFANRILANRIFADRVLANWRRRHRGRLLARQIGGRGNAQHGDERSRYDDDGLHDTNPLVSGTRPGRPSDASIPLCLYKTPASAIPRSGSIAGGNGSRLFVALAMDWFKCDWDDREARRLTKWSHFSMVGSDGELPVHCHYSFTV